jgi:hypothetical protein
VKLTDKLPNGTSPSYGPGTGSNPGIESPIEPHHYASSTFYGQICQLRNLLSCDAWWLLDESIDPTLNRRFGGHHVEVRRRSNHYSLEVLLVEHHLGISISMVDSEFLHNAVPSQFDRIRNRY